LENIVMRGDFIAVIPARAGSKGIPNKNRRPFLGRPLIEWTVSTAVESEIFKHVITSTDDPLIAKIAVSSGAESPFIRPEVLSGDNVGTAEVVQHAVRWLKKNLGEDVTNVIVLEPTSPGRQIFHIQQAASLLCESGTDTVASIIPVPHHFSPDKQLKLGVNNQLDGFTGTHPKKMVHRRQELPQSYAFDGMIFGCKAHILERSPTTLWGESVRGVLVEERYSVDLDEGKDWFQAEQKLRRLLV
jgi:CMP-N,N'-diacetyllegionaminic acid synthase